MNKKIPIQSEKISADALTIEKYKFEFIELIRKRLGIIIHRHQTNELDQTILKACNKFNCLPQEYLQKLQNCQDNSPLLEHLVAGITVGETYFFRDKRQMELLKNTLLPDIINMKREQGNLSLRIWSAGCASGEEIYSIAMLLYEMMPDINKWALNLLGTDLNTTAVQKAIAGCYSEWSMRTMTDYLKQRYFIPNGSQYLLRENIRDLVKFDYLNLNDNVYPSICNNTNAQDLILCRNVLIYFDNNLIAQLMQKLNTCLVPGGYLLLGASDPINIDATDLIFHHEQGMLFLRPAAKKCLPSTLSVQEKRNPTTKNSPVLNKHTVATPKLIKTTQPIDETFISKLLHEAQWQETLNIINASDSHQQKSVFLLNAKATAYANLGKLEAAVTALHESLVIDPTNKYSYFTYGVTLIELNRLPEAEKALRKTLFLDYQFVMGHYQLGLLLLRSKQKNAGLKCLRNALTIAKTKDPNQTVPGPESLSYDRLAAILSYEIELYANSGRNING